MIVAPAAPRAILGRLPLLNTPCVASTASSAKRNGLAMPSSVAVRQAAMNATRRLYCSASWNRLPQVVSAARASGWLPSDLEASACSWNTSCGLMTPFVSACASAAARARSVTVPIAGTSGYRRFRGEYPPT